MEKKFICMEAAVNYEVSCRKSSMALKANHTGSLMSLLPARLQRTLRCKMKLFVTLLLFFASQMVSGRRSERNKQLIAALVLVKDILIDARNCSKETDIRLSGGSKCTCETMTKAYTNVTIDFIRLVLRKQNEGNFRKSARELSISRTATPLPMDCQEVQQRGQKKSGVYNIQLKHPASDYRTLDVYCDMTTDGGGWTLIQRRDDYAVQENFYRNWKDYKDGFGNVTKDFWLGNENIHHLTQQGPYSIRFDLEDLEHVQRHAEYEHFRVGSEETDYRLFIYGYSGDAGDAMTEHNGLKFSTMYRNNDDVKKMNCPQVSLSGWWFGACSNANPNGLYKPGRSDDRFKYVYWYNWKGHESLKSVQMKVKRLF